MLSLNASTSKVNYFKAADPIFKAEFEQVHSGLECGSAEVPVAAGIITFPPYSSESTLNDGGTISCVWDIREVVMYRSTFIL
jgi:hypothetical protein